MKNSCLGCVKSKCLNKDPFVGESVSSKEELEASLKYAKEKAMPIQVYFSNFNNVEDFKEKMALLEKK